MQTILCQAFESLMESERAVFLTESLDNKGNGFYSRFINHLQGRFEIKIPRGRRSQFYPLTIKQLRGLGFLNFARVSNSKSLQ